MNSSSEPKKVLIVGGGFAGIKCALELEKAHSKNLKIVLVSDKPHFEYHAALYRLATGTSPFEVCIPIREIFLNNASLPFAFGKRKNVEVLQDKIVQIDLQNKTLLGDSQSHYTYDYLVLAVGSETAYFNIPGLKEHSFGLKSVNDALRLKKHIHEMFELGDTHIVIVGAGPTGTELAAQLASYTKTLAKTHKVDTSETKIDLIERGDQIMRFLPNQVSKTITARLRKLDVNVILNEPIVSEDIEKVYLKDMQIKAKTIIWTAGIVANSLINDVTGLEVDECGKVNVDEHLQAIGQQNVFLGGDLANTKYSGMAQTAINDGAFIAKVILAKEKGHKLPVLTQQKPIYAIPVGQGWAAVVSGNSIYYGKLGWFIRRWLDLKAFMTFLPFNKAWEVFRDGIQLCETCEVCSKDVLL